jgi:hypothetical protein
MSNLQGMQDQILWVFQLKGSITISLKGASENIRLIKTSFKDCEENYILLTVAEIFCEICWKGKELLFSWKKWLTPGFELVWKNLGWKMLADHNSSFGGWANGWMDGI